jgi:metal-sulfur cluster biosynthetic enzyme
VQDTLTSRGCAAGQMIHEDIERVVREIPGVGQVTSDLTFEPPWTPDKMSDDAKFILGFG